MSTDYHSQYWAWELTRRRASDESDKFSSTFYNATVDLNPHQADSGLSMSRRALFDQQDAVDRQKDTLVSRVEAQLAQKVEMKKLFETRWKVA